MDSSSYFVLVSFVFIGTPFIVIVHESLMSQTFRTSASMDTFETGEGVTSEYLHSLRNDRQISP